MSSREETNESITHKGLKNCKQKDPIRFLAYVQESWRRPDFFERK